MARNGALVVVAMLVGFCVVAAGLENTFGEAGLGYTIQYPADWVVEYLSDYTVRFGGAEGTPAARVSFTIQNVASSAIGGIFTDTSALLDDLKCQLVTGAGDICIYIGDLIPVVDASGRTLIGPQIVAEYAYDGDVYREWLAVVPHGSGDVFYVLAFTAPQSDYDRFEPTALEMLSTWTVGGILDVSVTPLTPTGAGQIVVLLQDAGHIGPYDYTADAYDKRFYDVAITSSGYLAIAVVDEAGESVSGWVYTPSGIELMHKPGSFAEIYTDAYEVGPGMYEIKVGQDTMVTESDFELIVYFSTAPFTVDDLEAAFGSRYRTMP
jgi:hypothetical protein